MKEKFDRNAPRKNIGEIANNHKDDNPSLQKIKLQMTRDWLERVYNEAQQLGLVSEVTIEEFSKRIGLDKGYILPDQFEKSEFTRTKITATESDLEKENLGFIPSLATEPVDKKRLH